MASAEVDEGADDVLNAGLIDLGEEGDEFGIGLLGREWLAEGGRWPACVGCVCPWLGRRVDATGEGLP